MKSLVLCVVFSRLSSQKCMGINTVSGRISDCNMYHRGIFIYVFTHIYSVKGGEAASFPKTVMESMMSCNQGWWRLGEVLGKKNIHNKPKSEGEFQGRYLQDASSPSTLGKRLRDKVVELSPWASNVLSFCCLFPWDFVGSSGQNSRSWCLSDARAPCQAFSLLLASEFPFTRSHHLTAPVLSDSSTGRADGPEAGWHPEHAAGSAGGSAPGTDPTCQTPADTPRVPPSNPENVKATGQPHVTLSLFHPRGFLSLGVISVKWNILQ